MTTEGATRVTRRDFLTHVVRGGVLLALAGLTGGFFARSRKRGLVWQLDPRKCVQCGRCATACVLQPSAVKCVHAFKLCGYCQLCTGFFIPQPGALDTGAENQLCPVGAIKRKFVEDPYYEYTIDEPLCIGCGKCVKGCGTFGNGSLHLQVRHDRCQNCNECSIARACPAGAYSRVPADRPYLMKDELAGRA
jgi:Na+-translocating ferredoxin:NAD+ oxidoreductase subunit B